MDDSAGSKSASTSSLTAPTEVPASGGDDGDEESTTSSRRNRFSYGKLRSKWYTAYYRLQKIMDSEEEWKAFQSTLERELPTSFRINSASPLADSIRNSLLNDRLDLGTVEASGLCEYGTTFLKPSPLEWYPSLNGLNELAWQCSFPKRFLTKREDFPQLKKFKDFLVECTQVGAMSRQEVVSMIPPLFLDVQPHHIVLDVCAAPGSKTAQILEAMHCGFEKKVRESAEDSTSECDDALARELRKSDTDELGFVIANDADWKRAGVLTFQLKRLGYPNFAVINKFGQCIPKKPFRSLMDRCPASSSSSSESSASASASESSSSAPSSSASALYSYDSGVFDRVLCDVPCSSDGTMRKNPELWRKWSPQYGNGLHKTQLMILERSIHLCRDDGLIVYATCSLNPIEDEAVISAAIERTQFRVETVDCSHQFPKLKRRRGLQQWFVCDRYDLALQLKMTEEQLNDERCGSEIKLQTQIDKPLIKEPYSKFEDVPKHRRKEHISTMFSPFNRMDINEDIMDFLKKHIELSYCMRFLPQDNDTGGFFVTVLRKLKKEEWQQRREEWFRLNGQELKTTDPVESKEAEDEADAPPPISSSSSAAAAAAPVATAAADDAGRDPTPAKTAECELFSGKFVTIPPTPTGFRPMPEPRKRRRRAQDWWNEDPVPFLKLDTVPYVYEEFVALCKHYGFDHDARIVAMLKKCLMVRSKMSPRTMWFVSPYKLADLVNEATDVPKLPRFRSGARTRPWREAKRREEEAKRKEEEFKQESKKLESQIYVRDLKLFHAGMKPFVKHVSKQCNHDCEWRITQDGVSTMVPLMSKQVVWLSMRLFVELVFHKQLSFDYDEVKMDDEDEDMESTTMRKDKKEEEKEQLKQLSDLTAGGAAVRMIEESSSRLPLRWSATAVWKSRNRVDLMISSEECSMLRSHLYSLLKDDPFCVKQVNLEEYWKEYQQSEVERLALKRLKAEEARRKKKRKRKRRKVGK